MNDVPAGTRIRHAGLAFALGAVLAPGAGAQTSLDICGCTGDPNSLGVLDTRDAAGLAALGATVSGRFITIPLPADGRLVFESVHIGLTPALQNSIVDFQPPPDVNPPVQLLVSGDVLISTGALVEVDGNTGGAGGLVNSGGAGGPGGFRGGDGAYPAVNFDTSGGAGLGPGGGDPGSDTTPATGGAFVGVPQLIPLIGGGGGGGGAATDVPGTNCQGAPGGGGGGALLIAANGTVTVNGTISADGGAAGNRGAASCSAVGAAGSGGAVRIVADSIRSDTAFTNVITATGGTGAGTGAIRLEAFDTEQLGVNQTTPIATRGPAPGPLDNPFRPTVRITRVGLSNVTEPVVGALGGVDVTVDVPGPVDVAVQTDGVPGNTLVDVIVKPRTGGAPQVTSVALANCVDGICNETTVVDLGPGRYVLEAQATFQSP